MMTLVDHDLCHDKDKFGSIGFRKEKADAFRLLDMEMQSNLTL